MDNFKINQQQSSSSQTPNLNIPAPEKKWNDFQTVTRVIFSRWTALGLAVEHGFGGKKGRDIGEEMYQKTVKMFSKNQKIYPDELEDLFYYTFDNFFNTSVEDGSVEEVSKLLTEIYNRMGLGDYSLFNYHMNLTLPKQGLENSIIQEDQSNTELSEDDITEKEREEAETHNEEEMEEEETDHQEDHQEVDAMELTEQPKKAEIQTPTKPKQTEPEKNTPKKQIVDEDGWTTVQSKKNRKKY